MDTVRKPLASGLMEIMVPAVKRITSLLLQTKHAQMGQRGDQNVDKFRLPNVARVSIHSPLRYPGGKSRWYFYIKKWILKTQPSILLEPFAGGAHVGLAVAIEEWGRRNVEKVILVELDDQVAAVWKTILSEDAEWLTNQIQKFEMNRSNVRRVIKEKDKSTRHRAFAMIVQNRISRGGITTSGSGWLKYGENDKGLKSRWYPDTLSDRIERINRFNESIEFIHGDAFELWPEYLDRSEVASFVDPPYPVKSERLYKHNEVNHEKVFRLFDKSVGSSIMTYGKSDMAIKLVNNFDLEYVNIVVSNTHNKKTEEMIIGKGLDWLSNLK